MTRLCQTLHVSRSGFYAWHRRPESRRAQQNRDLLTHMHVLHQQTREAYGGRKMWHLLKRGGMTVGGIALPAYAAWRGLSPDGADALCERSKPGPRKCPSPTSSIENSRWPRKTGCGLLTSPTVRLGPAGCIWPCSSISIRDGSLAET